MAHTVQSHKTVMNNPLVGANLGKFRRNDILGGPNTFYVKSIGEHMSQDTIRFAETAARLNAEFGNLDGMTVTELGSTYGGLAFILLIRWPTIKRYHLIDLPTVQQFSKFYLEKLKFGHPALSWDEPDSEPDLSISEYAITERTDNDLYSFYERYAKPAKFLWLRCNIAEEDRYQRFIKYINQDFSLEVIQEPCVPFNRIVIGRR